MDSWAQIFDILSDEQFATTAIDVFNHQAVLCAPYCQYIELIGVDPRGVKRIEEIPFMSIELFKSHKVYCGEGDPQMVFTSSATSSQVPSSHYVASLALYEESFTRAFDIFYGDQPVAIFALLPCYLEREGSSLVYMVDRLVDRAPAGGFYLDDLERLLRDMEAYDGPKILLGVSYALWDLAERYPHAMNNTLVMETGGMKGHRRELPKDEFHKILCDAFHVDAIHSEYGMAELMSQAYSAGGGIFVSPPWMRVICRDLHDPFEMLPYGRRGGVNIVDLANLHSCSFIQTQDVGLALDRAKFKIEGRISGSDIRGCNLLIQ